MSQDIELPENENQQENLETSEKKNKIEWTPSLFISLFAVLISVVTMGISVYEAQIMREQQKIMREQQNLLSEQKSASVYPRVQAASELSFTDSLSTFSYQLENKGVGPAFVSTATYYFDDKKIRLSEFPKIMQKKFPEITFSGTSNVQIDNSVLSADESITLVQVTVRNTSNTNAIMNSLYDSFNCIFCYCSIYGECWLFDGTKPVPARNSACEAANKDLKK